MVVTDYSLLDRAGVASTMFYPQRDHSSPPSGAEDHLIEVEPGVSVAARLYIADAARPTVLYFHGNGEVAGDHDGIAPLYHDIGLNLFVAEFRGYGKSTGHPTVQALVADAHPVAAYFHETLDRRGFAPERFIMGRSLGAHPALEIAANAPEGFAGLVIESGAGNLRRMLERVGLLDTELGGELAAAHEAKLRSIRLPTLVIHGEYDELISLSAAELLCDLLEGAEPRMEVIPGAGHNDLLWVGQPQYFGAIASFVSDALEPRRA